MEDRRNRRKEQLEIEFLELQINKLQREEDAYKRQLSIQKEKENK